jgi:hydrogenase maturation protease
MARVLVVGYGNPLRSNGGVGWQVAVNLLRTNTLTDVEVLPCHQLTPELVEHISRAETVLFIDCVRTGNPGEVSCEPFHAHAGKASFTHDLTPSTLLALSSELFGVCPKALLLSIPGESYAPGEALSDVVRTRVPALESMARRIIVESPVSAVSQRRFRLVGGGLDLGPTSC